MKYKFHEDAGHGWLAVPRSELRKLGILNKITPYSYQGVENGEAMVYLEEDCDFGNFYSAKKEKGETVEYERIYHEGEAPCRSFRSFSQF